MREDQLQDLWNQGHSDYEIAQQSGCSAATVCRWRQRHGLLPRSKRSTLSKQEMDDILLRVGQGDTLRKIAEETGVFVETIRKLANRRGVPYAKPESRTPAKEVHGTLGYGGYVELLVDRGGAYGYLVKHGGRTRGYAPLHRMRMHDKLGRQILPNEIVHHVDGDIYNNSLPNLEIFHSVEAHLRHHRESGIERCKESSARWKSPKADANRQASKTDEKR